jgi:hypothetical protein
MGIGDLYRNFIKQFVRPCLQTAPIDLVAGLLNFLPDDAAAPIIDIIQRHLVQVLEPETRTRCMSFEFRLWDQLGPELQTEFVERLIWFIDGLATPISGEALDSLLLSPSGISGFHAAATVSAVG